MILSTEYILNNFPHVFKNEFNERTILHRVVDEDFGKRAEYNFVTSGLFSGSNWGMDRAKQLRGLSRTLVLTKDKDDNVQLFSFWFDFARNNNCYSEINKSISIFEVDLVDLRICRK